MFDQSYYEKGNHGGMINSFWNDPVQQEQLGHKFHDFMQFSPKKGSKILFVGCAKGYEVRYFTERGFDAYGCDISQWAIENCDSSIKDRVLLFDGSKLPYPDNSFSSVLSFDVISLAKDHASFASEICRICTSFILIRTSILTWRHDPEGPHGTDGAPFILKSFDFWDKSFTSSGKFNLRQSSIQFYKPRHYEARLWFQTQIVE
jgi:hypothetical protein